MLLLRTNINNKTIKNTMNNIINKKTKTKKLYKEVHLITKLNNFLIYDILILHDLQRYHIYN